MKRTRVLMLGWEYPPRFAGGLGKACQGLAQGMARAGAQIFFVLPTFPEKVTEPRLEVVGARECLIESGWDPEQPLPSQGARGPVTPERLKTVETIEAEAKLYPYGAAPEGPVPERLVRLLEREELSQGQRPRGQARKRGGAGAARPQGTRARKPESPSRESAQENLKPGGDIYGKNFWSEIERYAVAVRNLADTHEVDVVHAHDWMSFPAAFEFGRATGTPVFVHVHATEYDRSGENLSSEVFRIEREGFRRATHIFAVSRYTAGIIERLYGVNRRKITVIYNAPENGHLIQEGAAKTGAGKKPQVVFLGRLTFQKGPDHFLRAAELVARADPQARFILCGTGDMMDALRAQSHRLGIEDRVHFAGFVDPSRVDEILTSSRVLVMPSVSEPFGLVAIEAIRCGIPTIISKQSGVREVLQRALQVDFWDHEKLADQIVAALRLPDLSRQLVNEGAEQLRGLSWDRSASRVLDTYSKLLGSTYAQSIGSGHGH